MGHLGEAEVPLIGQEGLDGAEDSSLGSGHSILKIGLGQTKGDLKAS